MTIVNIFMIYVFRPWSKIGSSMSWKDFCAFVFNDKTKFKKQWFDLMPYYVVSFFKYAREILRGIAGLSREEIETWLLWRHIYKSKCIFLVFPSVNFFKTSHTFL